MRVAANGEYLVSAGRDGVLVWKDGKQVARLQERYSDCLAVSQDGRWIAAAASRDVFVWDAATYEQVFCHSLVAHDMFYVVDFSPDSTQLIAAAYQVYIWDITTRKEVLNLIHNSYAETVKYSPQGDRILTATEKRVRVWDSNDGRLLVDIDAREAALRNKRLFWYNADHLLMVTRDTIKKIDASTGSTVSEWPVHDRAYTSCILPKHGQFIAYFTSHTGAVTFWETSTPTQLSHIQHVQDICSISISSDDRFLGICGEDGEITVKQLSRNSVSIPSCWIVAYMNNSLGPITFPHSYPSPMFLYILDSNHLTFKSTTPCSMPGSMINSRTRKHC